MLLPVSADVPSRPRLNLYKNILEKSTSLACHRKTVLQKTYPLHAFGGHIVGQNFGTSTTGKPRLNLLTLESTLEEAWRRLVNVVIECKDFRDLIPRYDRPHSFFFLDPPYWKIPGYKYDFTEPDFLELADILRSIKGKFLMTINDTPEVRGIFKGFTIEETTLKYSCCSSAKSRSKISTELLISNYV